jgi:hypothetical protein
VGGRRLRPALEDIVECLIVEGLVEPKAGWRSVLDRTRKQYRRRQVSAVVRRNPTTALKELRRLGYTVASSEDGQARSTQLFNSCWVNRFPTQQLLNS